MLRRAPAQLSHDAGAMCVVNDQDSSGRLTERDKNIEWCQIAVHGINAFNAHERVTFRLIVPQAERTLQL